MYTFNVNSEILRDSAMLVHVGKPSIIPTNIIDTTTPCKSSDTPRSMTDYA